LEFSEILSISRLLKDIVIIFWKFFWWLLWLWKVSEKLLASNQSLFEKGPKLSMGCWRKWFCILNFWSSKTIVLIIFNKIKASSCVQWISTSTNSHFTWKVICIFQKLCYLFVASKLSRFRFLHFPEVPTPSPHLRIRFRCLKTGKIRRNLLEGFHLDLL